MTLDLLQSDLNQLKGVGPKVSARLANLNLHNVRDLCFHLPSRYINKTRLTPMQELKAEAQVLVQGRITANIVVGKKTKVWRLELDCQQQTIELCFFHFFPQQTKSVCLHQEIRAFGTLKRNGSHWQIVHPELILDLHRPLDSRLTPIYPTTQGIHQNLLRQLVTQVLDKLNEEDSLLEYLPQSQQQLHLPKLKQALCALHFPKPEQLSLLDSSPAIRRLAFEEIVVHQLRMHNLKVAGHQYQAVPFQSTALQTALMASLSFKLTPSQAEVLAELCSDCRQTKPMMRLIQGDVGCGKTVVSALLVAMAIESGGQAALMAPTALLSEQLYQNFKRWFEPLGIQVILLMGNQGGKLKASVLAGIKMGRAQIIIGTHALFQNEVHYRELNLVVVDEQHRFGVKQRAALWQKSIRGTLAAHQLIMTATPIPRTLAMSLYTQLDCSSITHRPPGRQSITTRAISAEQRNEVIQRLEASCAQGQQAYWVCTLVEDSEFMPQISSEASHAYLSQALPNLTIGLIHGKMKARDKDIVMRAFAEGTIDVLVATTVIEVGIDVPNATVMIIEDATRLGLSQLHQLRGRVGRGQLASYCILLYEKPLSALARARLTIMRETDDGFAIANEDLKLRGPGEILGLRQSGLEPFSVAELARDQDMMELCSQAAQQLQSVPAFAQSLIASWDKPHDLGAL